MPVLINVCDDTTNRLVAVNIETPRNTSRLCDSSHSRRTTYNTTYIINAIPVDFAICRTVEEHIIPHTCTYLLFYSLLTVSFLLLHINILIDLAQCYFMFYLTLCLYDSSLDHVLILYIYLCNCGFTLFVAHHQILYCASLSIYRDLYVKYFYQIKGYSLSPLSSHSCESLLPLLVVTVCSFFALS